MFLYVHNRKRLSRKIESFEISTSDTTEYAFETNKSEQPVSLRAKVLADYRQRWPSEGRLLLKQAAIGAVHGLLFSKFVNSLPSAPESPANKKIGNALFNKHDAMFLLGFITPNKVDYYASSFLVASQTANQDCLAYQAAVKCNPELAEQAKNTLIKRQYAEKGRRRSLDYAGMYAGFIALRDLGLTTAMCAISSDNMSPRIQKTHSVLKYLRDGKT